MTQEASSRIEELLRERARLDAELERHSQLLTILFLDIVGSTRFYDVHGDLAGLVMVQKCLDTLVPIIEQHDGKVVKTIGDAILARFGNAQTAVRCAMDMQRTLAERNAHRPSVDQIRIRVALNLGLALIKGGDVFGDVVNTASRIESATDADEIAISPSVYEKISHLSDIQVRKKAEGLAMKGKAEKMDLYAVLWRPGEVAGPAPPRPKSDQLAMATGLHKGLAELAEMGRPEVEEPTPPHPMPKPRPSPARRPGSETSIIPPPRKAAPEPTPPPAVEPAPPTLEPAPPAVPEPSIKGTMVMGAKPKPAPAPAGVQFYLVRVGRDGSLGERHLLDRPGITVGQRGDITITNDPLVAQLHARFSQLGEGVYIENLDKERGVFLRLRKPHTLKDGDVILVGRRRMRFQKPGAPSAPAPAASPKGTQVFMGAPKGTQILGASPLSGTPPGGTQVFGASPVAAAPAPARLVALKEEGGDGEEFPLGEKETVLGRTQGNHTFPDDLFMSSTHARISVSDGNYTLEDLNSTNGTYVQVTKRKLARDGDTVLLGGQLLRVVAERT